MFLVRFPSTCSNHYFFQLSIHIHVNCTKFEKYHENLEVVYSRGFKSSEQEKRLVGDAQNNTKEERLP